MPRKYLVLQMGHVYGLSSGNMLKPPPSSAANVNVPDVAGPQTAGPMPQQSETSQAGPSTAGGAQNQDKQEVVVKTEPALPGGESVSQIVDEIAEAEVR
jgi:hypothetical protein